MFLFGRMGRNMSNVDLVVFGGFPIRRYGMALRIGHRPTIAEGSIQWLALHRLRIERGLSRPIWRLEGYTELLIQGVRILVPSALLQDVKERSLRGIETRLRKCFPPRQ
jgi:hypothetical protein